jgi:hypothetical protein
MASEPSLSPTSLRDVEKRPYQYEAVSVDERFSKTSAIDQMRTLSLLENPSRKVPWQLWNGGLSL